MLHYLVNYLQVAMDINLSIQVQMEGTPRVSCYKKQILGLTKQVS